MIQHAPWTQTAADQLCLQFCQGEDVFALWSPVSASLHPESNRLASQTGEILGRCRNSLDVDVASRNNLHSTASESRPGVCRPRNRVSISRKATGVYIQLATGPERLMSGP